MPATKRHLFIVAAECTQFRLSGLSEMERWAQVVHTGRDDNWADATFITPDYGGLLCNRDKNYRIPISIDFPIDIDGNRIKSPLPTNGNIWTKFADNVASAITATLKRLGKQDADVLCVDWPTGAVAQRLANRPSLRVCFTVDIEPPDAQAESLSWQGIKKANTVHIIKEHYFHEQNRRLTLDSATGFPAALLAMLGGLVAYYLQVFPVPPSPWNAFFVICIGLGVLFLVAAFVSVVLSFVSFRYLDLATMRDWLDHHQALKEYTVEGEIDVDVELEESLKELYAEAVDRNSAGNIRRLAFLYRAKLFVALAAFSLSLCAFPYFAIKSQQADKVHNVKIVPNTLSANEQGDVP
jgi:hypothetical protein